MKNHVIGKSVTAGSKYEPHDPATCPHNRVYCWTANDGTPCAGCCDCGAVLLGAVKHDA